MRVIFAGTPDIALPSLRAIIDAGHDVVAVLTRPDARRGRGRTLHPSPVANYARENNLPVLTPTHLRGHDVVSDLAGLNADVAAVVAYGQIVPVAALHATGSGWVNLHFSLLPAWRGAAPVQHAIWHGDDLTGATTFILEEGLDTGPVVGQLTEPINPGDTSGELLERLATAGAPLLTESIELLVSGHATPVAQPTDGISYAPKITTANAKIHWTDPGLAVDRHIRAMTPDPGPWTTMRDKRLKIGPVELTRHGAELPAGHMEATKNEVLVGSATTAMRLDQVAPAGKGWMSASDWARGVRPAPGEVLGNVNSAHGEA